MKLFLKILKRIKYIDFVKYTKKKIVTEPEIMFMLGLLRKSGLEENIFKGEKKIINFEIDEYSSKKTGSDIKVKRGKITPILNISTNIVIMMRKNKKIIRFFKLLSNILNIFLKELNIKYHHSSALYKSTILFFLDAHFLYWSK